ncbi:unnamed protein product, partial [Symbiodinium sp. KB8]
MPCASGGRQEEEPVEAAGGAIRKLPSFSESSAASAWVSEDSSAFQAHLRQATGPSGEGSGDDAPTFRFEVQFRPRGAGHTQRITLATGTLRQREQLTGLLRRIAATGTHRTPPSSVMASPLARAAAARPTTPETADPAAATLPGSSVSRRSLARLDTPPALPSHLELLESPVSRVGGLSPRPRHARHLSLRAQRASSSEEVDLVRFMDDDVAGGGGERAPGPLPGGPAPPPPPAPAPPDAAYALLEGCQRQWQGLPPPPCPWDPLLLGMAALALGAEQRLRGWGAVGDVREGGLVGGGGGVAPPPRRPPSWSWGGDSDNGSLPPPSAEEAVQLDMGPAVRAELAQQAPAADPGMAALVCAAASMRQAATPALADIAQRVAGSGPWVGQGGLAAATGAWRRLVTNTALSVTPSAAHRKPALVMASAAPTDSILASGSGVSPVEVRAGGHFPHSRAALLRFLWDPRRRSTLDPWVAQVTPLRTIARCADPVAAVRKALGRSAGPIDTSPTHAIAAAATTWWGSGDRANWVAREAARAGTSALPVVTNEHGMPACHTVLQHTLLLPLRRVSRQHSVRNAPAAGGTCLSLLHWQVDPPEHGGRLYIVEASVPPPDECDLPLGPAGAGSARLNPVRAAAQAVHADPAVLAAKQRSAEAGGGFQVDVHVRAWIITPRSGAQSAEAAVRSRQAAFLAAVRASAASGDLAPLRQWQEHPPPQRATATFDTDAGGCDVTFLESFRVLAAEGASQRRPAVPWASLTAACAARASDMLSALRGALEAAPAPALHLPLSQLCVTGHPVPLTASASAASAVQEKLHPVQPSGARLMWPVLSLLAAGASRHHVSSLRRWWRAIAPVVWGRALRSGVPPTHALRCSAGLRCPIPHPSDTPTHVPALSLLESCKENAASVVWAHRLGWVDADLARAVLRLPLQQGGSDVRTAGALHAPPRPRTASQEEITHDTVQALMHVTLGRRASVAAQHALRRLSSAAVEELAVQRMLGVVILGLILATALLNASQLAAAADLAVLTPVTWGVAWAARATGLHAMPGSAHVASAWALVQWPLALLIATAALLPLAVTASGGSAAPTLHFVENFTFERLSDCVFKVVQADHCGEFPFFYVILGSDKIIVIDTGVGPPSGEIGAAAAAAAPQAKRSLRAILDEQLNPAGLPYKILATHVHYDHIGNVAGFADETGHVDVAMGDGDKEYASRIADFACGAARGARVAPFTVTQWLAPGEEVFLDDSHPCAWNAVRALPTPGHTPDGTAYFFPREGRLFVADTVYPFTAISLLCRGSSLPGYAGSITNLLQVVDDAEEGGRPPPPEDEGGSAPITVPPPDMPIPAPPSPPSPPPEEEDKGGDSVADAAAAALEELTPAQREAVTELVSVWLGLEGGLAGVWQIHRWDPLALLTVCDWNVEGAVGMWGDMGHAGLRGMMPAPHASTSAIAAAVGGAGSTPDNVVPVALALPVA